MKIKNLFTITTCLVGSFSTILRALPPATLSQDAHLKFSEKAGTNIQTLSGLFVFAKDTPLRNNDITTAFTELGYQITTQDFIEAMSPIFDEESAAAPNRKTNDLLFKSKPFGLFSVPACTPMLLPQDAKTWYTEVLKMLILKIQLNLSLRGENQGLQTQLAIYKNYLGLAYYFTGEKEKACQQWVESVLEGTAIASDSLAVFIYGKGSHTRSNTKAQALIFHALTLKLGGVRFFENSTKGILYCLDVDVKQNLQGTLSTIQDKIQGGNVLGAILSYYTDTYGERLLEAASKEQYFQQMVVDLNTLEFRVANFLEKWQGIMRHLDETSGDHSETTSLSSGHQSLISYGSGLLPRESLLQEPSLEPVKPLVIHDFSSLPPLHQRTTFTVPQKSGSINPVVGEHNQQEVHIDVPEEATLKTPLLPQQKEEKRSGFFSCCGCCVQ